MYKVLKQTFCQLDLLFFHVLVAVAIVVCLRSILSLIQLRSSYCHSLTELLEEGLDKVNR